MQINLIEIKLTYHNWVEYLSWNFSSMKNFVLQNFRKLDLIL